MSGVNFEGVCARIDELSEAYVDFLVDICNIESPTASKSGVDKVGEYVAARAKARGWSVRVHEEKVSGNALSLTFNPESELAPICFSAHMDTVHPEGLFGYPPAKIEGDVIKGPGACDCKGGIATAFLAMAALEDSGYRTRPLKLILQSDEEISSSTSDKRTVEFMASEAEGAVAFLNCEPKGKGLIIERKGIIRYRFDVTGFAAHSSRCYQGVNAVTEAAYKIIELEKWKDENGITCNCGVISGGTVPNSVAEHCTFFADIRFLTEQELEEVKGRVAEIASTSYLEGSHTEATVVSQRINMRRCEKNIELASLINAAYKKYGFPESELGRAAGGSDAADMTYRDIPTVDSLGIDGGYIHSEREYAFVASLPDVAKKLAAVVLGLD